MLVEILCGGYGCRTKTGIHTVMRGEQCEVSESEARRLIGLGVAKSPYITDRGTASTLAAAPATVCPPDSLQREIYNPAVLLFSII